MRSVFLSLSNRRSIGRLATRLPFTRGMVDRFVAGETLETALPALRRAHDSGFRTTVDILGESVSNVEAARAAADSYVAALPVLDEKGLDLNVSVKLSQMGLGLGQPVARDNLARVLVAAAGVGGFVRIDMEDHTTTDATLDLWRQLRPVPRGARREEPWPPHTQKRVRQHRRSRLRLRRPPQPCPPASSLVPFLCPGGSGGLLIQTSRVPGIAAACIRRTRESYRGGRSAPNQLLSRVPVRLFRSVPGRSKRRT